MTLKEIPGNPSYNSVCVATHSILGCRGFWTNMKKIEELNMFDKKWHENIFNTAKSRGGLFQTPEIKSLLSNDNTAVKTSLVEQMKFHMDQAEKCHKRIRQIIAEEIKKER